MTVARVNGRRPKSRTLVDLRTSHGIPEGAAGPGAFKSAHISPGSAASTNHDVANQIWRACDVMRRDDNCSGGMEYLEHLSWLLLLKFLDDQGENVDGPGRSSEASTFCLKSPYRWRDWAHKALRYGAVGKGGQSAWSPEELMRFVKGALFEHLASIGRSGNNSILSAIFSDRNVVVCKSPENLRDVIASVDRLNFRQSDERHTISAVYEELLGRLGTENKLAGEFYTPRPVIRFMISVLQPTIGESVYDPACGSSGFLVECFEFMKQRVTQARDLHTLQTQTFYGNEKKRVPALLGLINMFLHGITTPHVRRQNTLEPPKPGTPGQFDVVLTNPPFGGVEDRKSVV